MHVPTIPQAIASKGRYFPPPTYLSSQFDGTSEQMSAPRSERLEATLRLTVDQDVEDVEDCKSHIELIAGEV